jgi:hypothetical protein
MKETEMPDKGDVQSQVTERLRIYFVAETLRRTLAAGYRPTPENIYLVSSLFNITFMAFY